MTKPTKKWCIVLLAGLLMTCATSPAVAVAAAPSPLVAVQVDAWANRFGLDLVQLGFSGLDVALIAGQATDCAYTALESATGNPTIRSVVARCYLNVLTARFPGTAGTQVLLILNQAFNPFGGTWTTNYGPIAIDKTGKGVLAYNSKSGGTSDFQFDVASADQGNLDGYTFIYHNTFGDSGVGAVVLSTDGCLAYGKYVSTKDASNTGPFYMIRCPWDGLG